MKKIKTKQITVWIKFNSNNQKDLIELINKYLKLEKRWLQKQSIILSGKNKISIRLKPCEFTMWDFGCIKGKKAIKVLSIGADIISIAASIDTIIVNHLNETVKHEIDYRIDVINWR